MSFVVSLFGEDYASFSFFFLAALILITLPMLAANFTALIVVAIITAPLLIDFVQLLFQLPIQGDREGYLGMMHGFSVLPLASTFLTRIVGLVMERRGWSRRKAIIFDIAGVLLYVLMSYLYREYGNINPLLVIIEPVQE